MKSSSSEIGILWSMIMLFAPELQATCMIEASSHTSFVEALELPGNDEDIMCMPQLEYLKIEGQHSATMR
jgi:hypothetical protein